MLEIYGIVIEGRLSEEQRTEARNARDLFKI